jgi:uncharacterized protein (DUF952 family)
MTDRIIYHICSAANWTAAEATGYYLGSTQDRVDGYIHFSTAAQVKETAQRTFNGVPGLVLLAVDAAHLGADLRWEPSGGGDLYPHLMTRMPVGAVIGVRPLPLDSNGQFVFPPFGPDGFL